MRSYNKLLCERLLVHQASSYTPLEPLAGPLRLCASTGPCWAEHQCGNGMGRCSCLCNQGSTKRFQLVTGALYTPGNRRALLELSFCPPWQPAERPNVSKAVSEQLFLSSRVHQMVMPSCRIAGSATQARATALQCSAQSHSSFPKQSTLAQCCAVTPLTCMVVFLVLSVGIFGDDHFVPVHLDEPVHAWVSAGVQLASCSQAHIRADPLRVAQVHSHTSAGFRSFTAGKLLSDSFVFTGAGKGKAGQLLRMPMCLTSWCRAASWFVAGVALVAQSGRKGVFLLGTLGAAYLFAGDAHSMVWLWAQASDTAADTAKPSRRLHHWRGRAAS